MYCFQGSNMESVTRKRELRRKQVASSLESIFVSHVSLVTFTSNVENVDSLPRCSTYMPFYNIHIKYSHDGNETNTVTPREETLLGIFIRRVRSCYIYERIYGLIISNLRHSAPWYQRQHARVTLLDRFQRACTLVRVRVYVHDKGNEGNEGKERRSSRKRVYSLG